MKIYTGTGDSGKTSLFSGERVTKNNPVTDAYGDIDELNAFIGALTAAVPNNESILIAELRTIQSRLFQVGALLATTPDSPMAAELPEITSTHIRTLEDWIDRIDGQLPPLSTFILPAGHPSAAWAHIARTVCRRAERKIVGLTDNYGTALTDSLRNVLIYINRLSDYLFMLSRLCNHRHRVTEIPWGTNDDGF